MDYKYKYMETLKKYLQNIKGRCYKKRKLRSWFHPLAIRIALAGDKKGEVEVLGLQSKQWIDKLLGLNIKILKRYLKKNIKKILKY